MRPIAIACLALTALAACSEPASKKEAAPAPTATVATLAGVDLAEPVSVLGTEPFWGLKITPTSITYTSPEGPPLSGANPGPVVQGTTAAYRTTLDGQPLELTLIATECSDGMSDRTYPLTAIVKLGQTRLNGCANAEAALAAEPPA
ncbi:MAG: hypothetical protein JWR59_1445 [Brevundimonas sp.]|nr:hypothetical protein [Brevundimonas sp.]